MKLLRYAWWHRRGAVTVGFLSSAGFASFAFAVRMDEATKRHITGRIREIRKMPGRLLT